MKLLKFIAIIMTTLFASCVGQKKYAAALNKADSCEIDLKSGQNENALLTANLANEKFRAHALEKQMEYFKKAPIPIYRWQLNALIGPHLWIISMLIRTNIVDISTKYLSFVQCRS
ncbi:MAG: hypothetical protein ACFCUL_13845 [Flavobacteriaceae bacterium]